MGCQHKSPERFTSLKAMINHSMLLYMIYGAQDKSVYPSSTYSSININMLHKVVCCMSQCLIDGSFVVCRGLHVYLTDNMLSHMMCCRYAIKISSDQSVPVSDPVQLTPSGYYHKCVVCPVSSYTITPSHHHTLPLSHPPTITPSHYHTLPPLHPPTITPSHHHTLPPLHPHTITPSHHHTLTPSHPLTITPSHHHTLPPLHPHTITPSYLPTSCNLYHRTRDYLSPPHPLYRPLHQSHCTG